MAGLIENTTESIHIGVYILDNLKIADKLMAAMERKVEVKILLEGAPAGGLPDCGHDRIKFVDGVVYKCARCGKIY